MRDRIKATEYVLNPPWSVGENLAWGGTTGPVIDLTAQIKRQHQGLFESAGHRVNIFSAEFRELGVGVEKGRFHDGEKEYLASMATHKFASSAQRLFLTGVVHESANTESFYEPGSGVDDVMIQVDGYYYQPFRSGAFSIELEPGFYRMEVTGGKLNHPLQAEFHLNDANIKQDIVLRPNGEGVIISR